MNPKLITLVEDAAKARGESPIPREFIAEALEHIDRGEQEVEKYPSGVPTMRGVFKIACMLYAKTQTKN